MGIVGTLRNKNVFFMKSLWYVSTDPEFAVKAADVVGLYLNPPRKAIVFCVDEKPTIQAITRKSGYVETSSGAIVRGMQSTYRRNGTLNLFIRSGINCCLKDKCIQKCVCPSCVCRWS